MASPTFDPQPLSGRRIPLAEIDALVSARLGVTRGLGNSQPACFNRQIAMYLAARVGRWSTTVISRFYGGRDHSTVCYGILRIESLPESDPAVYALITGLKRRLEASGDGNSGTLCSGEPDEIAQPERQRLSKEEVESIADLVAARLYGLLKDRSV